MKKMLKWPYGVDVVYSMDVDGVFFWGPDLILNETIQIWYLI